MKIHEYQAKEILRNFGVPVPRGIPAFTVQEAVEAAQKLGGPVWVVKAQIHAGGRGKGGGVKVAKTIEDVKRIAGEILGMQLKTHQTGPEGQKVRRLYIEDGADIQKEYYVSLVTDRATQKVAFIASSEGGMDIEEVAHATPEKIITEFIDPLTGLGAEQAANVAVQADVGQIEFRRFDFSRIFFVQVAVSHDIGVAKQRVRVKVELGVQRHQLILAVAVEWVDFDQRRVGVHVALVQLLEDVDCLRGGLRWKTDAVGNFGCLFST